MIFPAQKRARLRQKASKDKIRRKMERRWEASMQKLYFPILLSVVLSSPVALAQQPSPPTSDAIGHPPPLPSPPPLPGPPAVAEPSPVGEPSAHKVAAPTASDAAPKGYLGAYAPPGTPPTPYSTGPLPTQSTGPGLNVAGPDGFSTKSVRAVPCSSVARETDGFTTCVGIPEPGADSKRR